METPPIDAVRNAKGARKKARIKSLADLDGRTSAARAAFHLRDAIVGDLGGESFLSTMQMTLIENVAVLGAALQDMAAAYLAGEGADMSLFSTLANAQRRLLADLGLERRARDVTPDLASYVRSKGE